MAPSAHSGFHPTTIPRGETPELATSRGSHDPIDSHPPPLRDDDARSEVGFLRQVFRLEHPNPDPPKDRSDEWGDSHTPKKSTRLLLRHSEVASRQLVEAANRWFPEVQWNSGSDTADDPLK